MESSEKEDRINMEPNNLYQVCLFFTIGLTVFNSCFVALNEIGVFGSITPHETADLTEYTKDTNMPDIFGTLFNPLFVGEAILAVGGAIAIAIAMQNATFVGIYLFSVYFWAMWLNASITILDMGNYAMMGMSMAPLTTIILIITIPIGLLFIGAIIGMLSGV